MSAQLTTKTAVHLTTGEAEYLARRCGQLSSFHETGRGEDAKARDYSILEHDLKRFWPSDQHDMGRVNLTQEQFNKAKDLVGSDIGSYRRHHPDLPLPPVLERLASTLEVPSGDRG